MQTPSSHQQADGDSGCIGRAILLVIVLLLAVVTTCLLPIWESGKRALIHDQHKRALEAGDIAKVRRLFRTQADTEIQIQIGSHPYYWQPPLHLAIKSGNLAAVDYLLTIGASPNAVDFEGRTAFFEVAKCECPDNSVELVQLLCKAGGDINRAEPESGWTALMYAVILGSEPAVEALISNGADPTIKNRFGESAVDVAEKEGDEVIEAILRAP